MHLKARERSRPCNERQEFESGKIIPNSSMVSLAILGQGLKATSLQLF